MKKRHSKLLTGWSYPPPPFPVWIQSIYTVCNKGEGASDRQTSAAKSIYRSIFKKRRPLWFSVLKLFGPCVTLSIPCFVPVSRKETLVPVFQYLLCTGGAHSEPLSKELITSSYFKPKTIYRRPRVWRLKHFSLVWQSLCLAISMNVLRGPYGNSWGPFLWKLKGEGGLYKVTYRSSFIINRMSFCRMP